MRSNILRLSAFVSLLAAGQARSAGFMSTGPGARALSLGGAFTGLADDPSAAFYNPAGLAGQRGTLMFEHVPVSQSGAGLTLNDGRLDFLALQYPSPFGTFGLSMQQFAVGGIESRTTLADQATEIKATQTLYEVPYAIAFGRFAIGVTGKAVSYALGSYHDTGFGADLGTKVALFENDTKLGRETRVTAGIAVRNAKAPNLKLYQDSVALERTYAAGLAISALVNETYVKGEDRVAHDRLSFSFDLSRGNIDSTVSAAAGLEYSFRDRYAIRAGLNAQRNMTMGLGFGGQGTTFRLDYGVELTGLTPQHHFNLSWQFTAPGRPLDSDVKMTSYRNAVFDQERLKDRFLRQGREDASEGNYAGASESFAKAAVLDPQDSSVLKLVDSSNEGKRLAGVKARLDQARAARNAGEPSQAAKYAFDAVSFEPNSPEATKYAEELHNALASSATVFGDFEAMRAAAVEQQTVAFNAAFDDYNMPEMRRLLKTVKALSPDNRAALEPLEAKVAMAEATWLQDFSRQGQEAAKAGDALGVARALRRIRRIDPKFQAVSLLEPRLKDLSKGNGRSFYQANFLAQLYFSAAVDYTLGNYQEALQHVSQLLKERPNNENANNLVDRMRIEGIIKEIEEP